MPVFKVKGGSVWLPAESAISGESSPGGLSTVLTLIPLPGMAGVRQVEVEGRVETVGAELDAALAKYPPAEKSVLV